MSSGVLVRQALARGESRRAASVLERMRDGERVSAVLSRLGVHLDEASLGRSRDGPYVYYRVEPDREGSLAGRYRVVVEAAANESDAVAEVVTAFDRLTTGEPECAEFWPPVNGRDDAPTRGASNGSCSTED